MSHKKVRKVNRIHVQSLIETVETKYSKILALYDSIGVTVPSKRIDEVLTEAFEHKYSNVYRIREYINFNSLDGLVNSINKAVDFHRENIREVFDRNVILLPNDKVTIVNPLSTELYNLSMVVDLPSTSLYQYGTKSSMLALSRVTAEFSESDFKALEEYKRMIDEY